MDCSINVVVGQAERRGNALVMRVFETARPETARRRVRDERRPATTTTTFRRQFNLQAKTSAKLLLLGHSVAVTHVLV